MKQRKSLELYPLTMCYFIKRTQKCTKLFINHYLVGISTAFFLHWIYQFIVTKITAPKFMDPRSKYDLFSGCNLSDKEKDERSMAGYQLEIVNQGFLQLMSPLEKVRALSN